MKKKLTLEGSSESLPVIVKDIQTGLNAEKFIEDFIASAYKIQEKVERQQSCYANEGGYPYRGRVDIVTDRHLVEIKPLSNWMYAIGQIMLYRHCYVDPNLVLVLYGKSTINKIGTVYHMLRVLGIDMVFVGKVSGHSEISIPEPSDMMNGDDSFIHCLNL